MVLFGSLLNQFVSSFTHAMCFQNSHVMQIDSLTFQQGFDQQIQWIRDIYFVFNLQESNIKIYVGVKIQLMVIFLSIQNFELVARTRLLRWNSGGSDDTAHLQLLLLKIRSVRMLQTIIVWSGSLVCQWLFSPAWDAVTLTLDVGFICPFVVIDPTD